MRFLEDLIERAGEIPLKYFRSEMAVTDKRGKGESFDPVTRADRETEEFIRAGIAAEFPGHTIIGEEFGTTRRERGFPYLADRSHRRDTRVHFRHAHVGGPGQG